MDGLLSISYFNRLRAVGTPATDRSDSGKRIRPMMMTGLTAIFGLLPRAAHSPSHRRPDPRPWLLSSWRHHGLSIRYLMPVLYSFYGRREPPARGQEMGAIESGQA